MLLLWFLLSAWFRRIGGFFLTWPFVRTLSIHGAFLGFHSWFSARLFGLPPGCLCLSKVVGLSSAEVQRVWGIYDDRLQLMTRDDALGLDGGEGALAVGDESHAWSIWSSAAEAALADAFQFAGGPVLVRGLVLGGGAFLVRTVRLGGPEVRKARRKFADPLEGGDVFMYHDASTAVLLDLRRRFKAVGDLLHAVIRDGVTLARSLELTVQWDEILRIGPFYPSHCAGFWYLGYRCR